MDWIEHGGFSDAHHDGAGDLTVQSSVGIHQLVEVASLTNIASESQELYGVGLPGFCPTDVDPDGKPTVRQKDDLEIFRLLRLRNGI